MGVPTGPERSECGATELVRSGKREITANVAALFEREFVRRELGLYRVFKDHLDEVYAGHEEAMEALAAEFDAEIVTLGDEALAVLEDAKVDVSRWRIIRARRERIFTERLDGVARKMVVMTARGSGWMSRTYGTSNGPTVRRPRMVSRRPRDAACPSITRLVAQLGDGRGCLAL